MATSYEAGDIRAHVHDVDKVRVRAGMYLGITPILQCVIEGLDNGIDEFHETAKQQGSRTCNVLLRIEAGDVFTIVDRGRGIPIEANAQTKLSTLTTVLTMIQAGGKFGNKAYKSGKGTHGTGIAAANAVSIKFEVWTYRNRKWYYQAFSKGKPTTKVLLQRPAAEFARNNAGTVIRFKIDRSVDIIKNDKLDMKQLDQWLKTAAMLDSPCKFKLEYPTKGKVGCKEYYDVRGPIGYLHKLIADVVGDNGMIGKPLVFTSHKTTVACQWGNTNASRLDGFCNGIHNVEGGKHIVGFNAALLKAFNEVSEKKVKMADLKWGFVGFINVRVPDAQYGGQVKEKLNSPVDKEVTEELYPVIKTWLESNKSMLRTLVKRAADMRKAEEEADKLLKTAASVTTANPRGKGIILPGLLAMSDKSTPAERRELYIVEGDSAGGPAKNARNRMFQEVLPLSGKPINGMRHTLAKTLASKPVQNMLIALGADPVLFKKGIPQNPQFRVGSVILLPDGDNDGAHIANLINANFFKLLPSLFQRVMVYVVDSPLYVASGKKGEKAYGYTLKEIQSKAKAGWTITRMKGWGEATVDDLYDIAFNIETRKLWQILPPSKEDCILFDKVVGDDPTMRKQILGITGGPVDDKTIPTRKTGKATAVSSSGEKVFKVNRTGKTDSVKDNTNKPCRVLRTKH